MPKAKPASKKSASSVAAFDATLEDVQAATPLGVTDDDLKEERKAIARRIALGRFKVNNPDTDISEQLDEPGEKVALVDWLNGPIAKWIAKNHPHWRWLHITTDELDKVTTVRDFAKVCYTHVVLRPISGD